MDKKILHSFGAVMLFCALFAFNASGQKQGVNIGNKAPEIKMETPEGKTISLSELSGKMVLIDFWASWCKPCRYENPTVVSAFNKYKEQTFKNGEGFTVFSVSLDKDPEAWKEAIKTDNLVWSYHVCDFNGWQTRTAVMYGVRGIPSNFLIDGNGVIVGKNLRGPALEALLKQQLK
ncbi:TlpA family protein disulfide reductase [Carboxylicivirga caseinilyticus]|uniref:TlpA family protein disulfide reductase n=1 Tax=Carboxylicivirga caseinilyticus TaxID=3417572 RepID=UPI003D3393A3|nr:TlpA family protein disulfide reductase [Marinilabiliaceae bacterium A049]